MTWSIVARDPGTGQLGVAVASWVKGAGQIVPFIRAGVGAVASQGIPNPRYGAQGLGLMEAGHAPEEVLWRLATDDADIEHRQVHLVDAYGRTVAFTGRRCSEWAGDQSLPDLSVAGNCLASPNVLRETIGIFLLSKRDGLPFAECLLNAMDAGESVGGDKRGSGAASLVIAGARPEENLHLHAHEHSNPLGELRQQYDSRSKGMQSFIFDGNETPEQASLRKRRAIADAMMGQQRFPQTVGEGLNAIGDAFVAKQAQLDEAFPTAPGGMTPTWGTKMKNIITGGRNGGLF